jgi:hypothetical protein
LVRLRLRFCLSFHPHPFPLIFKPYSFFPPFSFLFPLSCCFLFFWNISFATAYSLLDIILFGIGKINIIEKLTVQNMQRTKQGWKMGEERNLVGWNCGRGAGKGGEQRGGK